ncbi:hypothetical protein KDW39_08835 [Burkholderia multivorans]|uniref:hypothetical protein n=1 Tax=Burkholderia multivorans TaxID=87883 RepID=UPI001B9FE82A|nr:hypothetical protein [Burkholderia multivorans]MBR8123253.1 hypothetical protein [Burkholderia multivorans]MBU9600308.1 hypothetical protein [Burkholderia multivorans]
MKKMLIGVAIAAMPMMGVCADRATCEVLVRAWAKNMAYTSACNASTGIEDELRENQAACKFIGKARAEKLIKEEFEAARTANLASHDRFCAETKAEFEQVRASLAPQ